jgi:hypothetical protein
LASLQQLNVPAPEVAGLMAAMREQQPVVDEGIVSSSDAPPEYDFVGN